MKLVKVGTRVFNPDAITEIHLPDGDEGGVRVFLDKPEPMVFRGPEEAQVREWLSKNVDDLDNPPRGFSQGYAQKPR